jgi:hypothetical protein
MACSFAGSVARNENACPAKRKRAFSIRLENGTRGNMPALCGRSTSRSACGVGDSQSIRPSGASLQNAVTRPPKAGSTSARRLPCERVIGCSGIGTLSPIPSTELYAWRAGIC